MAQKNTIEVCFSPALLPLYDVKDKIVVIIDIFRATSTIVTALAHGAKAVVPVASVEECIALGRQVEGSLTAGERNGITAPGLDYGNSPLAFPESLIKGKQLNLTTTNGTRLLHLVKEEAVEVIIGAFLNLSAVCDYLKKSNKDILLGCASWKDRPNMEDCLFAGAVVHHLKNDFEVECDSAHITESMYRDALTQSNLLEYLKVGSHYHRLMKHGLLEDLKFCTQVDLYPILPVLDGEMLSVK
ncbi:MAG TPA: 2-phosphosulfolactate phosphatase [Edaphocola sp.]|nr:2-phosphosulfolactate phosphatase [Edaphocola sp.]